MIFLAVLAVATGLTALVHPRAGVRHWARIGLGAAFVVAGVAHLAQPLPFEQHLPGWVPAATALVYVSGVVEIALGVALITWGTRRRQIGVLTAAYLVAVWPANFYVAAAGVDVDGQPGGMYPWVRIPFQVLFIAWAVWATNHPGSPDELTGAGRHQLDGALTVPPSSINR